MREQLPVFTVDELPLPFKYSDSYSIYRNILIQWDDDHDNRILDFVDDMTESHRQELLVINERKGTISFLWKKDIPSIYADDSMGGVESRDGDYWSIYSSKSIIKK